jgi:D-arabinose 1-dehydrogenase-like Zn-dependent alcohol dehydrogenase
LFGIVLFEFNFHLSSVLGHEAVVEVIKHCRPESDLAVGDRLTFSVVDSCGNCEFCLTGLNQKCLKLFKV